MPHAAQLQDPAKSCANQGSAKPADPPLTAAHIAQNEAKNNLCADGTIKDLTIEAFDDLQHVLDMKVAAGDLTYGDSDHLPADRSKLANIATSAGMLSEGDRVRFLGYVKSVVLRGSKETCNCERSADALTDIHLYLVAQPDDDQCQSIVAEIIPHFRPPLWTHRNIKQLEGSWIRVTGQLFMDGSHLPCTATSDASPARRSVWEIHPVYTMEVCSSEGCGNDAEWTALSDWLSLP